MNATQSVPIESTAVTAPLRVAAGTSVERGLLAGFSLRDVPGWLVSLAIHLAAFSLLLAFKFHVDSTKDASILSELENVESEQFFDTTIADQVGTTAEVTSLTSVAQGGALAGEAAQAAEAIQQDVRQRIDGDFKTPDAPVTDDVEQIGRDDLVSRIESSGGAVENLVEQGGVEGAIDRLAWEIMQSLHQNKTTVIWLFDQSLSLKERRNTIADRFENVYRQLESLDEGAKGALQTVVATYGEKFALLTDKPVEDVKPLIPKVRTIPNDTSGVENVFYAVHTLAAKFKGERAKKRNVLIFIVTDEKGDDAEKYLEDTLVLCRRSGIRVYTVGNSAPFGREKSMFLWKYDDGSAEELPVDAGPETVAPEALAVGFWGGQGPDLSRMSSGYGPYALTRLCKESGGMYYIAQEESRAQKFSPDVMRNYQPDYRPIKDYKASLERNKAKMALIIAARQSKDDRLDDIGLTRTGFAAYNDTVLREEITESQKPAADLIFRIDRLAEILSQGEKDRDKVPEPRWRAAYDLAIGRALAMKVRTQGYNQMLAEMKSAPRPFQNSDSNQWRIVPSKTINAGQAVKKLERQATTYLKRVIDDHPDTPWERLAARELSTPMGWEWQELRNPSLMAANTSPEEARRRIQLARDEAAKKPAPKKAPAPPPKEKPKL